MQKTMIALALVSGALAGCQAAPTDAQDTERQSGAVINGTREPTNVPLTPGQQLGVVYITSPGNPGSSWCSGTLIAPRLVSTAKHCVGRNRMAVGFGRDPSRSDPVIAASQVHNHPQRDVTILVLEQDATVVVPEVEIIPMNRRILSQTDMGAPVEVGGYGQTRDNSRRGRWFGGLSIANMTQGNLTVYANRERNFCFGDSGGPVFMNDPRGGAVTAAVISAIQDDGTCLGYGYVERLDYLMDWVDGIAAQATPDGGCAGIPYEGRCQGDVAQWCEGTTVIEQDCGASGVQCSFINEQEGYGCGCEGLDPAGQCTNEVAQRCQDGRLFEEDCQVQGLFCDAGQCTDAPPCEEGSSWCEESSAVTCVGGELVREDCAPMGAICRGGACVSLESDDPADPPGQGAPAPPGEQDDEGSGWVDESDGGDALGWADEGQPEGEVGWAPDEPQEQSEPLQDNLTCQTTSRSTTPGMWWTMLALISLGLVRRRR